MTVTLTPEQERFVAEQIKNGHYHSADDVIAQSLGLLRAQEEFIRTNTSELREQMAVGLKQIERGETVDGPAAIRDLRNRLGKRGGK